MLEVFNLYDPLRPTSKVYAYNDRSPRLPVQRGRMHSVKLLALFFLTLTLIFAHGSTKYVAGGQVVLDTISGQQTTVATVSCFDTKTQVWTTLPSLQEGLDHVGGKVIDDIFYVVGGRIDGITNVRGTVFGVDLSSSDKKWVERASMPTPRGSPSTGAIGFRIHTFSGEGNRSLVPYGIYDTESDTWERLPPMSFPRHGTNAASVGSRIYILGGGNMTGAGPVDINDSFRS